jgi:hypothetical protein
MKRPIGITLLLLVALSAAPGCAVKHKTGAQPHNATVNVQR